MKLPDIKTPETAPDIFAEYALSEEQTTPVSPIRRRRPSDVGLPRTKTNRELTIEVERLKDLLITSNMRVELLKKNNSQLQHDLTKSKEQIEELEPLEHENYELRGENDGLKLKVNDMDEEIEHLRDNNAVMHKNNEEFATLAEESASHWQDQEYAIDEAAECIVKLEEEKSGLAADLLRLKERVAALEETSRTNALTDGSPGRYLSRRYSLDESRPSTSHFDSDYYSQPTSPSIKACGDSFISITTSERSRKFLDMSLERKQSARDLSTRISAASLQALSIRPSCPVPEVPQIPIAYQQQVARLFDGRMAAEAAPMRPDRYRTGQQLIPESLLEFARSSTAFSDTGTSRSPTPHSGGFQTPERPVSRKPLSDTGRLSPRIMTSSNTATPKGLQSLNGEPSPFIPSRTSSRHASTSSSTERLELRSSRQERQLNPNTIFNETSTPVTDNSSSQWASLAPPPSVSVVSELATELDPRDDKDRWWRNMDRLTFPQVLAQSQPPPKQPALPSPSASQIIQPLSVQQTTQSPSLQQTFQAPSVPQTLQPPTVPQTIPPPTVQQTIQPASVQKITQPPPAQQAVQPMPSTMPAKTSSPWQNDSYITIRPSRSGDKVMKTASPYEERDFFFNGAEDEDTFIRKATAWIGVSRR